MKLFIAGLVAGLLSLSILASGLDLDVARQQVSKTYAEARALSEFGYSDYTLYMGSLGASTEDSIYSAILNEYTGYNAPHKYLDVREVSIADAASTIETSFANISKKNGARELLNSLKADLVDLIKKNDLSIYKIEHEGGFAGCKETALVDHSAYKILIFGSCWSE
ncbi:hypothetical protein [Bacteriovorax sp. Seq25_V]|uniref:hypothetical protein n=1 Tax=Bacteriovorax sp. Seq25_V TaxID=1201288 RepID=UPI00038A14EE|nr:hypothetical protein [Bacteriovorax sp. Seq25_V]EQC45260.1 hypothetical protein M900_2257 [Bacteriovorax sp. Seq25_V]